MASKSIGAALSAGGGSAKPLPSKGSAGGYEAEQRGPQVRQRMRLAAGGGLNSPPGRGGSGETGFAGGTTTSGKPGLSGGGTGTGKSGFRRGTTGGSKF